MPRPYCFLPAPGPDTDDIITRQILTREHDTRRCYIARTLVAYRMRSFSSFLRVSDSTYRKLSNARTVQAIRELEARETKRYWRCYFDSLQLPGLSRRQHDHPVTKALDACSFFFFGILLRWILVHRLSPSHGFLHENSAYAALAYDLMEPYRIIMENAVHRAWTNTLQDDQSITGLSLDYLRAEIDQRKIYIPATRQVVRQKNLLHGIVLALRAYLVGDMARFVPPVPGERKGGRPVKVSYRLPGGTSEPRV